MLSLITPRQSRKTLIHSVALGTTEGCCHLCRALNRVSIAGKAQKQGEALPHMSCVFRTPSSKPGEKPLSTQTL